MRTRKTLAWLGMLLMAASGYAAEPADSGGRRVQLELQNVTLADAAQRLSQVGGVTVNVDESIANERVSVQLAGVPAAMAVKLLAEVAGLDVVNAGPGSYRLVRSASTAPARPAIESEWIVLQRTKVKKVRVPVHNVAPSMIAAYYGRPGLKQTQGGVKLEHPQAPAPVAASAWFPVAAEPSTLKDHAASLKSEVDQRFQARLADASHRALALPDGVLVLLGYDPASKLIAVGKPAAVDAFAAQVAQLDAAPVDLTLRTQLLTVPSASLANFGGVKWTEITAGAGQARASYAVVDALPVGVPFGAADGPTVKVTTAQPAVLALSRITPAPAKLEGCEGVSPDVAKNLDAVVATTDVKLVAWPQGTGAEAPVAVVVDPVAGDIVADLRGAENAAARLTSTVPSIPACVALKPGQTLLWRSFAPVGRFRAVDACPLLSQLPLVGSIYTKGTPSPAKDELVLVITPSVGK